MSNLSISSLIFHVRGGRLRMLILKVVQGGQVGVTYKTKLYIIFNFNHLNNELVMYLKLNFQILLFGEKNYVHMKPNEKCH